MSRSIISRHSTTRRGATARWATSPLWRSKNNQPQSTSKPPKSVSTFSSQAQFAITLVSLASTAAAQSAATGTITGRVGNSRLGGYLENARVGLGGGKLDALTDSDGYYFIHDVPAGRHTVRVHYTGADPQAAE
ncbi:MAG: carboxypeptidase-like regulatory domain-containing protein, partial [Verrucomicrobia bacterium]|nr:carboxypeptidase-like regulatory domain-containing protein [Verrucomicrobiota bacterium]